VSYIAIQLLGPFAVWAVDDDGRRHPANLRAGAGAPCLLAALVFPLECKKWDDVGALLWSYSAYQLEPKELLGRTKKHASRVRTRLKNLPGAGIHHGAIAEGRTPAIIARGTAVHVDWDDLLAYQTEGNHKLALSLIAGNPLIGVHSDKLIIDDLVERVREKVKKAAYESLKGVKRLVAESPESLSLDDPVFAEFGALRPDKWVSVPKEPPIPAVPSTGGRTVRRGTQPPPLYGSSKQTDLFESCREGERELAREMREAADEGADTWWSEGKWFGEYFAFWCNVHPLPCDEIKIAYIDEAYNAARFGISASVDAPKDKATIVDASSMLLLRDPDDKRITFAVTNWGFAYDWARVNGDSLLADPSRASIFGVSGRPAYPGIAGVHVLFQTSDGYLMFGLRAPKIAFHERTWSASFEEQISVGARDFTGDEIVGDQTLLDTVHGGLYEEWGIDESAVAETSCLAIGREWGQGTFEGETFLNRSATIIAGCRLNIPLKAVWANLDELASVPDRDEHRAWAGIGFGSREDVLRFVAAAKGCKDNANLLAALCDRPDIDADFKPYPGGASADIRDHGLMPTSAARLVLASGWLETLRKVDNSH
jgi:hypothetical protein